MIASHTEPKASTTGIEQIVRKPNSGRSYSGSRKEVVLLVVTRTRVQKLTYSQSIESSWQGRHPQSRCLTGRVMPSGVELP